MATREPKKLRPILTYSLAILAGALILRDFDTGEGSHRTDAVRVDSTAAFVSTHRHGAGGLHDLSRCLETLRLTEASAYEGTGRNIFRAELEPVGERTVSQRESMEQKSPPPVVPTSFPLKLFGFSRNGKTRSIFLLRETDVFIAHEGDIVDRRYRIVRIEQNSAQVEDLLNNQQQELWFRDTP